MLTAGLLSGRSKGNYVLGVTWNPDSVCRPFDDQLSGFERCPSQAQAAFHVDASLPSIATCHHPPYDHHEESNTIADLGNNLPCLFLKIHVKFRFWRGLSDEDKERLYMQIWGVESENSTWGSLIEMSGTINDREQSLTIFNEYLHRNELYFLHRSLDARVKVISKNGELKTGTVVCRAMPSKHHVFTVRVHFDTPGSQQDSEESFKLSEVELQKVRVPTNGGFRNGTVVSRATPTGGNQDFSIRIHFDNDVDKDQAQETLFNISAVELLTVKVMSENGEYKQGSVMSRQTPFKNYNSGDFTATKKMVVAR